MQKKLPYNIFKTQKAYIKYEFPSNPVLLKLVVVTLFLKTRLIFFNHKCYFFIWASKSFYYTKKV